MITIIILVVVMAICMILGYIVGVNAAMKVLPFVGTLNIAHDSDGEKYTSLAIDKKRSDFMDDTSMKYVIFTVKHLYAEEKKKMNE